MRIISAILVLLCAASAYAGEPPNIVVLVADDLRWDSLGAAGNGAIHTPNLDRIAREGTRFTNAFATTAICCTSRVSILTGMYASTHGIDDFRTPVPEALFEQTYPARLRAGGYYTGFAGKWGIGGPMPTESFDVFDGFPGQGKYFNEIDGETVHMTTLIGGKATSFLDAAPKDQPFCLSVSFKAPHVEDAHPLQFLPDPRVEYLYAGYEMPVPASATEAAYEAMPEFIRDSENRNRWQRRFADAEMNQRSLRGYYGLVTGIDRAVGDIVSALRARGELDNTIIIFTSDHGFFLGEYGLAGKWLMHEASIRIPLLVLDPRIAPRDRVHVRDEMGLLIDLAPTVVSLAGVDAVDSMQGRDLSPLLRPGTPPWRTSFFYEHYFGSDRPNFIPASEGVRTPDWKYVRYVQTAPVYEELYDLRNDPLELNNLASSADHASRRADMESLWASWSSSFPHWEETAAASWKEPGL